MGEAKEVENDAFAEVLSEIAKQEKRASNAKGLDLRHELSENVYPILGMLAEAANTRFEEIESAVEEYLLEEGNVIYTDLAEPLFGLIAIAKRIGAYLTSPEPMTDVRMQALKKDAEVMLQTIAILEPIASSAVIAEGEVADDDEDGDDEDEEDDDDGDDDPDGGGEEAAAAGDKE